jgi:hypothetical protein
VAAHGTGDAGEAAPVGAGVAEGHGAGDEGVVATVDGDAVARARVESGMPGLGNTNETANKRVVSIT